jgi:putative ABC transport system permease protein
MIQRLKFYLMYAIRNIQRGGRWTTLAILCITAGVSTVVALRSLGLAIGDTLTENVRIETKGDILVFNDRIFSGFGGDELHTFSERELTGLQDWADQKGAQTSAYMSGNNVQVTKTDEGVFGRPSFIGSYFIDPQTYPPTHTIRTIDPPNIPISELFTGGNDVIVSDNLASQGDIDVGDEVRVSGTQEVYIVRGIVASTEETSIFNFLNGFFGFAYFDIDNATAVINEDFAPNRMGILFPDSITEEQARTYANEVEAIATDARTMVTYDLLQRYEIISQYLGDFIVVMGLGALLIGGVGIMNTMLVLVRRRTNEIAAIKTFGVKARQVATLFFVEALLLGFIGSILGIIVGIGLSTIVNQYGAVALQQPIIWRIYPESLLFGFTLGMVVTGIFGVAPILTAVQVRPSIILRPNENQMPALGILQSFVLLLFVTISLGLIVGHIVRPSFELTEERMSGTRSIEQRAVSRVVDNGDRIEIPSPYLAGVISVGVTFIVFGILIAVIWVIVYLIGKFPTFGSVTARLALRNLSTHRLRTSITLLALSAGMLALSSITFVGEGTRELLNIQLSQSFGGNVLVFPFPGIPDMIVDTGINNALKDIEVEYRTTISNYSARLLKFDEETISRNNRISFAVWDSNKPDIYAGKSTIIEGRMLTPEDRGKPLMVMPEETALQYGIQVGSRVTISLNSSETIDLDVMGITGSTDGIPSVMGSNILIPPDVFGGSNSVSPRFKLFTFQVPEESLNQALAELSAVIVVFSLDVSFVDSLIGRLIDQFAAIPTIVGLLSLFAAAVIMANTVALATLERRRQIGVLKAIGLKSGRVLRIMLIESSIIGLLSAIIGIGTSVLIMTLLASAGGFLIPLPANARFTALALIVASIFIGWVATFLSARVAINERVMNVLRYE